MKKVIVTVTNDDKSFYYDIEFPTNIQIGKLTDDLIRTLQGADPKEWNTASNTALFDLRLERMLDSSETLENAGVWNGDILVLKDTKSS